MDQNIKQKAAKTIVDAFIVINRIYRHVYKTLDVLKEHIKTNYDFSQASSMCQNPDSSTDPETWFPHFKGLYLSFSKINLEDYRREPIPVLFLQASLYNPKQREPILRYGVIKKVSIIRDYKGAKFDDYFRRILMQIHSEPKTGIIKSYYHETEIDFTEKPLLDYIEEKDIEELAKQIGAKYIKQF